MSYVRGSKHREPCRVRGRTGPVEHSLRPQQPPLRPTVDRKWLAQTLKKRCKAEMPVAMEIQQLSTEWDSVQFSSVPTLCHPMNRSTPGLPVYHQLPEFTQTHVHRVSDAMQPSHPLSSPFPPAPNPSQHQGLFQ